jgi:hypothetical protein
MEEGCYSVTQVSHEASHVFFELQMLYVYEMQFIVPLQCGSSSAAEEPEMTNLSLSIE